MLVKLKDLQPNPFRDMAVDPVEPERVDDLVTSIKDFKFWGGMPCRLKADGTYELAAGLHRKLAAEKAGIKEADLPVSKDMTDMDMVRIYSVENSTQRGAVSFAQAGVVAATVRLIAKAVATGDISKIFDMSTRAESKIRTEMESGEGIGEPLISKALNGVPNVNSGIIKEQLASLKASGTYERIINEVQAEIQQEHQEALREEEEATKAGSEEKVAVAKKKIAAAEKGSESISKASKQANKTPQTLHPDIDKIFTKPSHAAEFRRLVMQRSVKPYAPVAKQKQIALDIIAKAKELDEEVSARFIREHIIAVASGEKLDEKRKDKAAQEKREQAALVLKYQRLTADFGKACRQLSKIGMDLADVERSWPKGTAKPHYENYFEDVRVAREVMNKLYSQLKQKGLVA